MVQRKKIKEPFLSFFLRKNSSLISAHLKCLHPGMLWVEFDQVVPEKNKLCLKVLVHVFSLYVVRVSSRKMAWLFILTGLVSLKNFKKMVGAKFVSNWRTTWFLRWRLKCENLTTTTPTTDNVHTYKFTWTFDSGELIRRSNV